ncbi:gephyrin-like molybdotransferase Glp [Pontibacter sp. JAM-7]|uniref:molybdopterin molybdotransferase MoeA n=1 Tax=Pontibacter sp. JAM-7 TaxID=3366581 RepID=UPI003AF7A0AD
MKPADCDSSGLIPVKQALAHLLADAPRVGEIERVALQDAGNRVLAVDLVSAIAVPPADNSAMDGYAVCVADLPDDLCLPVSQRIAAGQQPQPLAKGTAARIFTGSEIPPGADAVVMQEQCQAEGDRVRLQQRPPQGNNIRPAGQDIQPGQPIVSAGTRLDGRHLGVIASVGTAEVEVYRRLRVTLLTTGDELVMPGQPCAGGQIYNSNYFSLQGLLQPLAVEVRYPGIVPDSADATRNALAEAAENSDLIITSGGVSVGEEDHVKAAVEALGHLDLWRLAIKPGKPLAYGRVGQTPLLGLPGNPAAVLVTFLLLARPYLLTQQGVKEIATLSIAVKSNFSRERTIVRDEYLRACLQQQDGECYAGPIDNQSSGVLSSSLLADGLLCLPAHQPVAKGQMLRFYPFASLLA